MTSVSAFYLLVVQILYDFIFRSILSSQSSTINHKSFFFRSFRMELNHENILERGIEEYHRALLKTITQTQRTLAARLTLSGIEFSDLTILRIERGERFVPDYEIAVIAEYFKVSADYLLGRTNQ